MLGRLYRCSSDISRRHSFSVNSSGSCDLSATRLQLSLRLRYRSCIVDVSVGTGLYNSAFSLFIVFCMVSVFAKKSFHGRVRAMLICKYKDKHVEVC